MKRFLLSIASGALCAAAPAFAYEAHTVNSPDGRPMFELRFYDPEDGPFLKDGGEENVSSWHWQPQLKTQVIQGVQYWAEVLQPARGEGPAIINLGTDDEEGNAYGLSPSSNGDSLNFMQRHFFGLRIDQHDLDASGGAHSYFALGPDTYPDAYRPAQLPPTAVDDLFMTSVHELAHGFGMSSSAGFQADGTKPRFSTTLEGWAHLMRDDNGRAPMPGAAILCGFCENPYEPDAFDVRQNRGRLVGPNIADALEGGLPGVPLSMYVAMGEALIPDSDVMAHSELKNSMMSHQNYRNYTVFMEAELAVLQDLGYGIDRRNFFGRSVYGSGLDIVNDRGFYARDAQGSRYLTGEPNRATLGLGLHVYGSHNRIRQTADLLANGVGGAGVRVDGEGNTLIIDPGVRVHANGPGGQAIMFAYGKNHALVHRGDVQASGEGGVGLRFDFGNNALGNNVEYRGSYIQHIQGQRVRPAAELQGPLVRTADITGRVAGSAAAIYISPNAYVGSINVMDGARIEGNIVSHYAERDGQGARRLTQLSFGQKADAEGRATGQPDPAFRMRYDGWISGRDNLVLAFDGGETRLGGAHEVHGVAVRPGATLAGATAIALAGDGEFLNEGTVAPGNSIGTLAVHGNYRQTSSGRLQVEFNSAGQHDLLAVSGALDLAGTLELQPEAGWYDAAWRFDMVPAAAAGATNGAFETVSIADVSPTLDFRASPKGGARYEVAALRASDAYSRHAAGDSAREVGRTIERNLAGLPAGMTPFVAGMDFSARDGSGVARALEQASPQGYSAGLAASLLREREVMEHVLSGFGEGLRHAPGADWKGYAVAFGGSGSQDQRNSTVGYDAHSYGLAIGGGRRMAGNPDIALGVHLDIAEQSVSLDTPLWGKSRATAFGVGAQLRYRPGAEAGWQAHGAFRVGVEHASMDRKLSAGNYYAAHSADWTGHSASVEIGGGYRWRLSDAVSAGPLFALNYARVSRPGVEESGPAATRLTLESRHVDALRSSLGVAASLRHALADGSELRSHVQLAWDHEWLDRDVVQTAAFAAMPGATFESRNAVLPRNSASLRAGLTWQRNERMSLGASLGGRLGGGYKAVEGQVSLRWAF